MDIYKYRDQSEAKPSTYPLDENIIRGKFRPHFRIPSFILDKMISRKSEEPTAVIYDLDEYRANRKPKGKSASMVGEWIGAMVMAEAEEKSHWLMRIQNKIREVYHPTD
jgi:hypothetical protein